MKIQNNLRYGYTTGTCAAAATKAALYMLINQKPVSLVEIQTPSNFDLLLNVDFPFFNKDYSECAVRKDAGDDPDVTNGLYIFSKVEFISEKTIEIFGSEGVGIVTKKGLSVPVGDYAINPVPKQMIEREIERILKNYDLENGVRVTLSIPKGEVIAKNTLNPKLGIKGGLSILGTTGIVKPISHEAFENSLRIEISQLSHYSETIVLTPGNTGMKKALEYGFSNENIVIFGNSLSVALEVIKYNNFNQVYLIGELGKLIKVAGGIFNTHSKVADARKEIFVYYLMLFCKGNLQYELIQKLTNAVTTKEMLQILREYNIDTTKFLNFLENIIIDRVREYLDKDIKVHVKVFSEGD
ncbi:MAG: cobalt-precorrin-5B (C(1))-methyltransferase CbiD [Fervidobacterium sp.]